MSCQDTAKGMTDTAHDGQELAPHLYLHNSHPDQSIQPLCIPSALLQLCTRGSALEAPQFSSPSPRHGNQLSHPNKSNNAGSVRCSSWPPQKTCPTGQARPQKKTFMQVDQHTIPTQTNPPQQNKNKEKVKKTAEKRRAAETAATHSGATSQILLFLKCSSVTPALF